MDSLPRQDFVSGWPGPAAIPGHGVYTNAAAHSPNLESVMRLVADEDTFRLAKVGLRRAWPDLELPFSRHDTELPSDHHDCTQVMVPNGGPTLQSPARAGLNNCGDQPRTTYLRALRCEDARCTSQGLPATMHRLRCGHHLCRGCLTRRATGNVVISPAIQHLLATTSEALYDLGSERYARTRSAKEALLTRTWKELNWTCCDRIVPFGDFLHRGCLSRRDAEALVQMSVEVLRRIEGEGNRRLLRVLDDVTTLGIRLGEEVAVFELPDLTIVFRNPFQSTPANPAGSGEGMPRLAAQRAVLHAEMASWTLAPNVLLPDPATPMIMADEPQIAMVNEVPPDMGSDQVHVDVSAMRLYDGHPYDMSDGHPFAIDNGFQSNAAGRSSDGAEGSYSSAGWGSEGMGGAPEGAGRSTEAFGSACQRNGIRMSR